MDKAKQRVLLGMSGGVDSSVAGYLLRQQGYGVTVLPIADLVHLEGAGIATSDTLVAQHPDLVRRFVQATYRGLKETNADPVAAFAISRK